MELPVRMKATILWSALAAGAVGIPGAFGAHADVPVLLGIWTTLLIRLASQAGESMSKATAAKVAAGVLVGIGGFQAGVKLATTYFAYTGVGTIPAIIVNAGANASLTYIFGRAAGKVFLSNSLQDSAAEVIRAIVFFITGNAPADGDT